MVETGNAMANLHPRILQFSTCQSLVPTGPQWWIVLPIASSMDFTR